MFKVLTDWKGSPDGFTVIEYKIGQTVELHSTLVDVALSEGWVERVTATSIYAEASKAWVGESVAPAAATPPKQSRTKKGK